MPLLRASTPELHVLEHLRGECERTFGRVDIRLQVASVDEREASKILRVAVLAGREHLSTLYVKFYKSNEPASAALVVTRRRVLRDFEVSSRLYESMASLPAYRVARPVACFPDHLAIVTAEARGETLSQVLERRAAWWPSPRTARELGGTLSEVGGWIRAFQAVETSDGSFSLDDMRAYIDVRLRRLLATYPPALDAEARERVLRYFDRNATLVESRDLREVLTHADLAPSNVLVYGREVTVIDFAMAAPGSIFMDVARLYTQLEFLTAKPKFRPAVVRELQRRLLEGFDPTLRPERPLFRLFLLQHLLCHMSNLARNPAPALARLYNRHQLRLRQRWLQTFAA
jgi:hypothetical protein